MKVNLSAYVVYLRKQAASFTEAANALEALNPNSKDTGKHKISPAARARISAAQKARWAKYHRQQGKVVTFGKRAA